MNGKELSEEMFSYQRGDTLSSYLRSSEEKYNEQY